MKHTPGPWKAQFNGWKNILVVKDSKWVAEINFMEDTSEPNALLIAAAPELLEALEGLTEELEKIEAWDGDCPWLIPFVRQARAVINKTRRQGV